MASILLVMVLSRILSRSKANVPLFLGLFPRNLHILESLRVLVHNPGHICQFDITLLPKLCCSLKKKRVCLKSLISARLESFIRDNLESALNMHGRP